MPLSSSPLQGKRDLFFFRLLFERLHAAHGGGAPEPFQGAVQEVVQPEAAGPGLKKEDGNGGAQACPRPHALRQSQPPPEEQEREYQRLGDVARQLIIVCFYKCFM